MIKDIVKSSAQFVYVSDSNRTIRAQVQVGNPLVGLPQWNPILEVFVPDENGTHVSEFGFVPSRLVDSSGLGGGNQDILPDGFDGLKLSPVQQNPNGSFIVGSGNLIGDVVCTVELTPRGNPDDSIPNIIFSQFNLQNCDTVKDIFVKYSYECDDVSKHRHSVWGMLRLRPDPITMHQVMWFVNS